MAIITYVTRCPCCGLDVEAEISVQPEQQGGPETEYLPEHWELADTVAYSCVCVWTVPEAQAVVDDARREHGR